jgi:hypothetical protein
MNEDKMASFSNELSQQTWESVLKTEDVNQLMTLFYTYLWINLQTLSSNKTVKIKNPGSPKV